MQYLVYHKYLSTYLKNQPLLEWWFLILSSIQAMSWMTATLKSLLGEDVSGLFLELALLFVYLEMKPEILIVVPCVKW